MEHVAVVVMVVPSMIYSLLKMMSPSSCGRWGRWKVCIRSIDFGRLVVVAAADAVAVELLLWHDLSYYYYYFYY